METGNRETFLVQIVERNDECSYKLVKALNKEEAYHKVKNLLYLTTFYILDTIE